MTSLFSLRLQQDPDFAATASHKKNEKCQHLCRYVCASHSPFLPRYLASLWLKSTASYYECIRCCKHAVWEDSVWLYCRLLLLKMRRWFERTCSPSQQSSSCCRYADWVLIWSYQISRIYRMVPGAGVLYRFRSSRLDLAPYLLC